MKWSIPFAALGAAILLAPTAAHGVERTVNMQAGLIFSPQTVQGLEGDTFKWTNQDGAQHSAVSFDDGKFATTEIGNAQSTTPFEISNAGAYDYRCGIH